MSFWKTSEYSRIWADSRTEKQIAGPGAEQIAGLKVRTYEKLRYVLPS